MSITDQQARECSRCGKCCTNESFMGSLGATGEDVLRWERERRWDILQYALILGPEDSPFADLWIDADGDEKYRCPLVRKDRGRNTHRCTIYDTRPQVCQDYKPWSGLENDVCEDVRP